MQLLAGSLNVPVDDFLHAGYISAYPRSFTRQGGYRFLNREVEVIDVAKSLELKQGGEATPTQPTIGSAPVTPSRPASMVSDGFVLLSTFLFFSWLLCVYFRRVRKIERVGWAPWLFAIVLAFVWVVAFHEARPPSQEELLYSQPPPWRGVAIQEYRDPEAATRAIQVALIVNSLPGCPVDVIDLAVMQGEVAFPEGVSRTPGMNYALKTYGLDGWGREFLVERLTAGRYRVASAGKDGRHGTDDDLVALTPAGGGGWEGQVNGLFVSREEEKDVCFVHRVSDSLYKPSNPTADERFDRLPLNDLVHRAEGQEPPPILVELAKHRSPPRDGRDANPLLFVHWQKGSD